MSRAPRGFDETPVSRMPSTAPPSAREGQLRSAFTVILEELCHSCSGALATALVDHEGESVDVASRSIRTEAGVAPGMAAFPTKLSGAHWQIVVRDAVERLRVDVRQIWVLTDRLGYVAVAMPHGYVLLMVCRPESLYSVSHRALRECEVELCIEAGWPVPRPDSPCWRRAGVRVDDKGRPAARRLSAGWVGPLELLGRSASPSSFERGFLVRTSSGAELELVREASGFWYARSEAK